MYELNWVSLSYSILEQSPFLLFQSAPIVTVKKLRFLCLKANKQGSKNTDNDKL